jgi:hypothetical protein
MSRLVTPMAGVSHDIYGGTLENEGSGLPDHRLRRISFVAGGGEEEEEENMRLYGGPTSIVQSVTEFYLKKLEEMAGCHFESEFNNAVV